jgi:hypothetical protein
VLVHSSDLLATTAHQLDISLIDSSARPHSNNFKRWFRTKLDTHSCSILVDGLDELSDAYPGPPSTHHSAGRLSEFLSLFPRPRVLMATRPSAQHLLLGEEVTNLDLLGFDDPQVTSFLDVWFGQHRHDELDKLFEQHSSLKDLARIPLGRRTFTNSACGV